MDKQSFTLAAAGRADAVRPVKVTGKTPDVVKDAGRVRIGAGLLRFTTGKTFDAVKDTGRVRVGAGLLRF